MNWSSDKFMAVLRQAHAAERAWVEDRRTEGLAVAHGVKLILPGHNPREDFCPTPDCVATMQLEIKVRGLKFTSPDTWPFTTVYVDDLQGLSRGACPFAWVYISQKTGHWVWLCAIDRDESWREETVFDTMRGFRVPTLVAPRRFLRPAEQLLKLIYRADQLGYVEGSTGAFSPTDRWDERQNPDAAGRDRKAPKNPG